MYPQKYLVHDSLCATPAGLAPDFVVFSERGLVPGAGAVNNVQRPEALEALFMLWRVTRKPMYREWAWSIFQAFDRESKVRCLSAVVEHLSWPQASLVE